MTKVNDEIYKKCTDLSNERKKKFYSFFLQIGFYINRTEEGIPNISYEIKMRNDALLYKIMKDNGDLDNDGILFDVNEKDLKKLINFEIKTTSGIKEFILKDKFAGIYPKELICFIAKDILFVTKFDALIKKRKVMRGEEVNGNPNSDDGILFTIDENKSKKYDLNMSFKQRDIYHNLINNPATIKKEIIEYISTIK
jgi:hypothetical protein